MNLYGDNNSSDDLDEKLLNMKRQLQENRHNKDLYKVKKLSLSVKQDLSRMNRKIRELTRKIEDEQRTIYQTAREIEQVHEEAYDEYKMLNKDFANRNESIDILLSEKNKELEDMYREMVHCFNSFCNTNYDTKKPRLR